MKTLSFCVLGFSLATCTVCLGQIDIYQSDAYSVEEMCAREAEQSTSMDYTQAYESCIQKNSSRPQYQKAFAGGNLQSPEDNNQNNADQPGNDQDQGSY